MFLHLKFLAVTALVLFSEVATAQPAIILDVIKIYVEYKKICPTGLVNVEQQIQPASPSIGYNRAMRLKAAKDKQNMTQKESCIPL